MLSKLLDVLPINSIRLGLRSNDGDECLRELAEILAPHVERPAEEIRQRLAEREAVGSTGIGEGVAIPHCKLEHVSQIHACLAISPAGVDFNAQDALPVRIFLALVSPLDSAGAHLLMLARIASLLKSPQFREALLRASNPLAAQNLIEKAERLHDRARARPV